jgi:hypothetical protein
MTAKVRIIKRPYRRNCEKHDWQGPWPNSRSTAMPPMRRLASPTMAHKRRKARNDHDQAISASEQGPKPHYKVRVMLPNVAFTAYVNAS